MQVERRFSAAFLAFLFLLLAVAERSAAPEPGPAGRSKVDALRRVVVAQARGTRLLEEGRAFTAVQVFDGASDDLADLAGIPPAECGLRSDHHLLLGEALELLGRLEPALSHYQRASETCPESLRMLEDTLRLTREIAGTPTALEVSAATAERMLVEGDLQTAAQILRASFSEPSRLRGDPAPRLLRSFARYCATAPVDSDQFDRSWLSLLEGSRPHLSADARAWAEHIVLTYKGELPSATEAVVRGHLSAWTEIPDEDGVQAELLKAVGDELFQRGEEDAALQRYALAWALRRDDPTKALYLMNLLAGANKPLDPEGEIRDAVALHFSNWDCGVCPAESARSRTLLLALLD